MISDLWVRFTNSLLPAFDEEFPFRTMIKNFLSVIVPVAWVVWIKTDSILMTFVAFIAPPAFALLQGAVSIWKFRILFGDAPHPRSPAHGVVVVSPTDAVQCATTFCNHNNCEAQQEIPGVVCSCQGGRRWRTDTKSLNDQERNLLEKALKQPPLRLLVIGDSLALGVGTERSCTPLLPEILARSLSKSMGGRAVYWTSHGETGASAAWIVKELEHGIQSRETEGSDESKLELSDTESNSSGEEESGTVSSEEEEEEVAEASEWQEWRTRLRRHRRRFDPEMIGPYDVAVVITGPNDMKVAFFPFLLYGDDVEYRKQAQERGGGYSLELRRVLEVLKRRMTYSIDSVRDNVLEVRDNIMEQLHLIPSSPRNSERSSKDDRSRPWTCRGEPNIVPCSPLKSGDHRPLIVLPGLPTRSLPAFFQLPLRWFAIPIYQTMDNHKRDLERSHPGEVLYVAPPRSDEIALFEEQQGHLWDQRMSEDTLLSLRDCRRGTCRRIVGDMMGYYKKKGSLNFDSCEFPTCVSQHNAPVPPVSTRRGRPGSKIFSVDQAHPSDEGYDFWGRYIADHIVKNWHE